MPAYDIRTEYDTSRLTRYNMAPVALRDIVNEQSTGGSSDVSAPTVTLVSPLSGGDLTADGAITVDVTDVGGLSGVFLSASFTQGGRRVMREVIYDIDGFDADYSNSTRTAITNGFRFILYRSAGWPVGLDLAFKVIPFDQAGN